MTDMQRAALTAKKDRAILGEKGGDPDVV